MGRADLTALSKRLAQARERALLAENRTAWSILPELRSMQRLGLNPALFFMRQHWAQFVGESLARHTTPLGLKDGTLKIQADSPLYRQELTYAAPRILRIAQDHLGADQVRFIKASR